METPGEQKRSDLETRLVRCSSIIDLIKNIDKRGSETLDKYSEDDYIVKNADWRMGYKIGNEGYEFYFTKYYLEKGKERLIFLLNAPVIGVTTLRTLLKKMLDSVKKYTEKERIYYFVLPGEVFGNCYLILVRVQVTKRTLHFQTRMLREEMVEEIQTKYANGTIKGKIHELFFLAVAKLGLEQVDFEDIFRYGALSFLFRKKIVDFIRELQLKQSISREEAGQKIFHILRIHATKQADILLQEKEVSLSNILETKLSNETNVLRTHIDLDKIISTMKNINLNKKASQKSTYEESVAKNPLLNKLLDILKDWEVIVINSILPGDSILSLEILSDVYENFLQGEERTKFGIYYTPTIFTDLIAQFTINSYIESLSSPSSKNYVPDPNERISRMLDIKILDPTVGSGSFLVSSINYLTSIFLKETTVPPIEELLWKKVRKIFDISLNRIQANFHFYLRLYLLANCVYGVDIRKDVKEIATLRLYLLLFNYLDAEIQKRELEYAENSLDQHIIGGKNSLIGLDFVDTIPSKIKESQSYSRIDDQAEEHNEEELRAIQQRELYSILPNNRVPDLETLALIWPIEFKEVAKNRGFDIIIGNPPFAKVTNEIEYQYAKIKFEISRRTKFLVLEKLFVEKSLRLLREGGIFSLILPKPLLYVSDWKPVRELILKYELIGISDLQKAFQNVKLEQIVIAVAKQKRNRKKEEVKPLKDIVFHSEGKKWDRKFITRKRFVILRRDVSKVLEKLQSKDFSMFLGEFASLVPGLNLNRYVSLEKTNNNTARGVRGRDISALYIKGNVYLPDFAKERFNPSKGQILTQRILAHVQNPFPRLKIMASLNYLQLIPVNTISVLIPNSKEYSPYFLVAALNSRLVNWYAYHFIYCDAIRSMDLRRGYYEDILIPYSTTDNYIKDIVSTIEATSIYFYHNYLRKVKKLDFKEKMLNEYAKNTLRLIDYILFHDYFTYVLGDSESISVPQPRFSEKQKELMKFTHPLEGYKINQIVRKLMHSAQFRNSMNDYLRKFEEFLEKMLR